MTVNFIKFDPKNIIPDGKYWIVTQKKYGKNHFSATFKRVNDKMTTDVSNQTVIMISTQPVE